MFRGIAQLTLDNKGRLAVPAKHRDALLVNGNGRLVITADPSRCLLIYPLPAWEPIQQKLDSLSNVDPSVRKLQRFLIGNASDVEMDGAGRILVPGPLRAYAQLEKNVVLVGQGAKFELWDQEKWDQQMEEVDLFKGGVPPELAGFSL